MMGAEEKRKNEIATRAKLAPYIRNDDRITATEGMIKSGLLTKADDGTVVVSAKYDQYADKKGLAKYIDFYNQTGGDGSKLSGDALIDFANRFEGEQKFIAEKAANAKAKTETELKLAQIAKLKAEAAAKASETGLVAGIMAGLTGGNEAPDSPTAGIDLSRYVVGGGSLTPTTTPGGYVSPSVTTVADTVPGVAAPAAAAPAASPVISTALTAGTKAAASKDEVATMAADLGMTKAGLIQAATRYGQTPQEYAANLQSMLDARGEGKAAPAEPAAEEGDFISDLAAEVGMSRNALIAAARAEGVTPAAYAGKLSYANRSANKPAAEEGEVKTWADAAKATGEPEATISRRGKALEMTPAEYVADWKETQAAMATPDAPAAPAAEPTAVPAAYAPTPDPGPLMTEASPDAKKAREINKLTDEQMVLNQYLMELDNSRVKHPSLMPVIEAVGGLLGITHSGVDADGNIVFNEKDSDKVRARFAKNAKRLIELRGEGEAAEPAVSPALTAGTTGTPAAPAAATAEQPAEPAAGQAQQEQQTTAAGTTIPEKFDVAAESVAVKERLDKVNTEREAVRTKFSSIRTKNAFERSKQRRANLALGLLDPNMSSAVDRYLESSIKFENEAEARELKALDEKEAAINRDFANYQAAAGAKKGERTEARLDRAAQLAENKASADVDTAKQQKMSDYPTIGIWTHLGANVKDPTKYKIPRLDPNGRIAVNEANEGFNSATSFLIRLDEVLEQRIKGDTGWRDRFRLTAENMQSYFEGELASIFGVATMRRAIVSGGNFSDADREFVKQAITYINTAAPDMSPKDLKASMKALSVFVNRMFVNKLESYNMVYDPASAKAQAKLLRDDGYDTPAAFVEKTVNQTELFYRRFGVKPPMEANKADSQMELKEAFDLLYPKMKDKGLLPKGMKIN
jgi:hypothetical protein